MQKITTAKNNINEICCFSPDKKNWWQFQYTHLIDSTFLISALTRRNSRSFNSPDGTGHLTTTCTHTRLSKLQKAPQCSQLNHISVWHCSQTQRWAGAALKSDTSRISRKNTVLWHFWVPPPIKCLQWPLTVFFSFLCAAGHYKRLVLAHRQGFMSLY